MTRAREYDLVALGGGTAGLVSGMGAVYLRVTAAIVERSALGGDCLWTGCVPSKALIASARVAHAMRHADELGLVGAAPAHAFRSIMERMRNARATVAHHDDPERIRGAGVTVEFGTPRFVSPDEVEVEGVGRIRSKRFVLATGAKPSIPGVPGLEDAGFLTHETAFDQDELPDSLVMLGGGPVGLELAQVYARLGSRVTIVEREDEILNGEDPDASSLLRASLEREGVQIETGVHVDAVHATDCGIALDRRGAAPIRAHRLFVATGRRPVSEGLQLERPGIELDGAAVRVDRRLRTTARSVWAAGDVTGGLQFTHAAEAMAKAALQNSLFPVRTSVDPTMIPRVTYTDPEVAHVGLGHSEARERGARAHVYELDDLDRAITDGDRLGIVKISADRKGRILAATIVGSRAGDLIFPLVLARRHGLTLAQISSTTFPYPTFAEGIKRTADAYQKSRLEGAGGTLLRKLVSWLA